MAHAPPTLLVLYFLKNIYKYGRPPAQKIGDRFCTLASSQRRAYGLPGVFRTNGSEGPEALSIQFLNC